MTKSHALQVQCRAHLPVLFCSISTTIVMGMIALRQVSCSNFENRKYTRSAYAREAGTSLVQAVLLAEAAAGA